MSTNYWNAPAPLNETTHRRARWRRWLKLLGMCALTGFLVLNVVAFIQARAMTHYAPAGTAGVKLEALTLAGKARVLALGAPMPRPANHRRPAEVGLESRTVSLVGAHGLSLEAWHVPVSERRGIVVLFHGHGGSKASLLPVALAFHSLGWDTLLVDFHGSGGSAGSETSIGYYEAEDVAAAFDWAVTNAPGQPVVLYGTSMGAAATLRAVAGRKVRPDALVLECPFDSLLNAVGNRFRIVGLPAFPFAHLLLFWGSVQQGMNAFAFSPASDAAQVHCPTLLMAGGKDWRVTEAQTRRVFAGLPEPKQLLIFPELGHESFLAREPAQWTNSVSTFLKRQVLRGSSGQ